MITRAKSISARSNITKVATAMTLIALPTAGVGVCTYATPGGTPTGYGALPAPPPADPVSDAPKPSPSQPAPPPAPPQAGTNANDWVWTGDGGGGGGGGG